MVLNPFPDSKLMTGQIGTAETTIQGDNGKMRQISKIMNMGKCFSEIKVIVMLFYVI